MIPPNAGTIGLAKALDDNGPVSLRNKRTTSDNFGGFFYIGEEDRSSAIRIVSDQSVSIGQLVDIAGTMGLWPPPPETGIERAIIAEDVAVH